MDNWIYPHRKCVQVVCWWEQTQLHKQIVFAVPLLPYTSGSYPVHQKSPMPIDTQAVFTVEVLLNIARGSLGGFYIPPDVVADSRSHEDNMFRFTFHGQHSENNQELGHQLSTEELSMPLKELVGKLLWIKVEGGSPPTQNLINLRMQSTIEDKSNHPSDWATHIQRDFPNDIARCPFTACLSPIACHIIECGQNDEAYEKLAKLSHVIRRICSPDSLYRGEPGFLDVRFPIPAQKAYKLASLPLVETHTNGMTLERQFHETFKRYWWLIYRGEAIWTYNKPCPVFQTYGWDPQMLPPERDAYRGERKPRKIRDQNWRAQLQDLAAIISFTHCFGTAKYFHIIRDVVGRPPLKKRKTKQQDGSRKRARSDDDNDGDIETDSDTGSESDDEVLLAHKEELVDTEQRNITAQMMLIWLANCWSIQAKRYDESRP